MSRVVLSQKTNMGIEASLPVILLNVTSGFSLARLAGTTPNTN
jgi:hypothetical protein